MLYYESHAVRLVGIPLLSSTVEFGLVILLVGGMVCLALVFGSSFVVTLTNGNFDA
jgi:hypothetical protein